MGPPGRTQDLRQDDGLAGRGDDVYAALVSAFEGLDEGGSLDLAVRALLLLANEVGDPERVITAIAAARRSIAGSTA